MKVTSSSPTLKALCTWKEGKVVRKVTYGCGGRQVGKRGT